MREIEKADYEVLIGPEFTEDQRNKQTLKAHFNKLRCKPRLHAKSQVKSMARLSRSLRASTFPDEIVYQK